MNDEPYPNLKRTAGLNVGQALLSVSWQSVAYGLGIFGRQFVVYLTLPLFTRLLSQVEYGIVVILLSLLAFVNTLTNIGLPGALFRIYHGEDSKTGKQQVIGSTLILFFAASFFPALILIIFARAISFRLFESNDFALTIIFVAVILVVETLMNYGYLLLRLQRRPLAVSLHSVFLILTQSSLRLLLVWLKPTAEGYFGGQLMGSMIGMLLIFWLTRCTLTLNSSRGIMREVLAFSLPLLPAALATWALRSADKTLVGLLVGVEQAAVYGIGYKIGLLVALGTAPFNAAWAPFAFSIMHKENAAQIYRHTLTAVATLYFFIALVVALFTPELLTLLAPESYVVADRLVIWVAFGQVFWGLYPILSMGPTIAKRTSHLAYVTGLGAVGNILLNLILLPLLGIRAAAIASLATYVFVAVATYVVGQYSYKIPLDWLRLARLVVVCIFLLLVGSAVTLFVAGGIASLLLRGTVLMLYPLLLLFSRVVSFSELYAFSHEGRLLIQEKLLKSQLA